MTVAAKTKPPRHPRALGLSRRNRGEQKERSDYRLQHRSASASPTSDLGGGDFVVKRVTADLLDPVERPLDHRCSAATRCFPKREHSNGSIAVAEIQRLVRVAPARYGLAQGGGRPADRHTRAVKARRIGKDSVWRSLDGVNRTGWREQKPEHRDCHQNSAVGT